MSKGKKEDGFEHGMSFEEILKKAATTKVDPVLIIEKVGKEYPLYHANGKRVLFTLINIYQQNVENFIVKVHLTEISDKPEDIRKEIVELFPLKDHDSFLEGNGSLPPKEGDNPKSVSKNMLVTVSVVPTEKHENETFEMCYITYKLLDD